jgi:hypothetical protein
MNPAVENPRNLALVVCNIASLIPEDHVDFKKDVMRFITGDLAYRAPEVLFYQELWTKFELTVMKKYIPLIKDSDEEWKKKIIDVYLGKTPIENVELSM